MFEKVSLQVTAEHVFLAQFVRKMHVEVEVVVHHENALVMVDGVPMTVITDGTSVKLQTGAAGTAILFF